MKKKSSILTLFILLLSLLFVNQSTFAHCEIPCGIYEDSLRVSLIKEHVTTIEKSIKMISELSKEDSPNYNQIVRWVMNKEKHAKEIQEIVSQYFLHQRVKITDSSNKEQYNKYVQQLKSLHEIAVYAMKTKQSTDATNIEKLRKSIKSFEEVYFHSHEH
ncbi:MAG: superoxide dismutase [Ni] [Bacteroidota bacterium]